MDKLTYTAVLELVPLMQIPGVKKVGVMILSFWFTTTVLQAQNLDPNIIAIYHYLPF